MDLVDDIDAVLADLRGHLHLVHQGLDIVDAVVGGGVHLVDAVGTAFLEGNAGLALAAGFHVGAGMGAVDHLREDARRGRLTDAAGAAEEISVRELPPLDGVREGPGDGVLADEGFEGVRPVLPG